MTVLIGNFAVLWLADFVITGRFKSLPPPPLLAAVPSFLTQAAV